MKEKSLNLTYGLIDGKITHISRVESGLGCGCFCPACGDRLIAKKGDILSHHFAHQSNEICEYGVESALHLVAKEIIAAADEIMIPEVRLQFPHRYRPDILIHKSMKVKIDHVELEKRFDSIIPDVVVYSGGKKFFIEIFVTHAIDERKLREIKDMDISTIEIDLSGCEDLPDEKELSGILLEESPLKAWVYNVVEERLLQKYIAASKKMKVINRGFAKHVNDCPKGKRIWNGQVYANAMDDCLGCDSLIAWEDMSDYLFCIGNTVI